MVAPSEIGNFVSSLIRQILQTTVDILTPVVDAFGVALIVFGFILVALRQEWIALRWITAGLVAIVIMRFVVPTILQMLL